MKHRLCTIVLGGIFLVVLWVHGADGVVNRYVEQFTTSQHEDTLYTTAWWNTTTGNLQLHPFEISLTAIHDTPGDARRLAVEGNYVFVADYSSGLQIVGIVDPQNPTLAGSYDTPGNAFGVDIAGDYAFVADHWTGLQVIDIGDPTAPTLAGAYDPGSARDVVVGGDHAYVAGYDGGLHVIDISDPAIPSLAATCLTSDNVLGVTLSGNYAYLALGGSGLAVVDISDPTGPAVVGAYNTPGQTVGIAIAGDYAYAADHTAGLQVIDISDPASPSLVGTYNTPGVARDVFISGDYAYVADDGSGVQVIDITAPTFPSLLHGYDTAGSAEDIVVTGEHAFVADGASGLQILHVADHIGHAPALVGNNVLQGETNKVVVSRNYAYVLDEFDGLQVVDISDPTIPAFVGIVEAELRAISLALSGQHVYVGTHTSPGLLVFEISDPENPVLRGSNYYVKPYDLAVHGDFAYCAGPSGLNIVDVSDPTSPAPVGSYDTPNDARGVAIAGDFAYVSDRVAGLFVIDISNPTAPMMVGSLGMPHDAARLAVAGDYAYISVTYSGLQVVNVSDPANPALMGIYDTPGSAGDVVVSGDIVYVSDYDQGLQLIDATDPWNPISAGSYSASYGAIDLAVAGGYVYIADRDSGLLVVDPGRQAAPVLTGSYDTFDPVDGIAISGDRAYLATNGDGLLVADISDPANPIVTGSYDPTGYFLDIAISGDYGYLASASSGLQVVDISNPALPVLAGSYATPDYASDLVISGDIVYVADRNSGLQVIDVSNPASPALAGSYDTPGTGSGVAVAGDYAYMADGSSGFVTIDIGDPTNPTLAGSYATPQEANRVVVAGNLAYVAGQEFNLQVIDISDPANPALAGTYTTGGVIATDSDVAVVGDYAYLVGRRQGVHVIDVRDPANLTMVARPAPLYMEARSVAVSGDHVYVGIDYGSGVGEGLRIFQCFWREEDITRRAGQSLAIGGGDPLQVVRVHLAPQQAGTNQWSFSASGGDTWDDAIEENIWVPLVASKGNNPLWRCKLGEQTNSACTDLTIDWRFEAAIIDTIVDVPGDQGGWVRVHVTRSGYDFADEDRRPIAYYYLWRRIDDPVMLSMIQGHSGDGLSRSVTGRNTGGPIDFELLRDIPIVEVQGRYFMPDDPAVLSPSFPPGSWEIVGSMPGVQQDEYIRLTPTQADSSDTGDHHSVYVVSAHTTLPSRWYLSPPDSGYSVDNIAPGVPEGFAVTYYTGSGNHLSWDPSAAEDFQYFKVYRSSDPDFDPAPQYEVQLTADTEWTDPDHDGWDVHYKLTAVDDAGNESDPAFRGAATAATEPAIPAAFALYQNVPNPFNPVTTIRFGLATSGPVSLRIFNASGALVRVLVDEEREAKFYEEAWDGKDNYGAAVASGVYFYRLNAGAFTQTRKMVLLK